jgi:hypothetical protein
MLIPDLLVDLNKNLPRPGNRLDRQINDIRWQGSVVARTSETQPYPPKTAAPHKAAAKISMWRAGYASMESSWRSSGVEHQRPLYRSLNRIRTESRMFYHGESRAPITRHETHPTSVQGLPSGEGSKVVRDDLGGPRSIILMVMTTRLMSTFLVPTICLH